NSLAHTHGARRFVTGDDSRNNWWLAVLTMGEGWHNNHHAYPRSARQGFRWYEIDLTFYILTVLSSIRVVHALKDMPANVVRNHRPLARTTIERAARQLAASVREQLGRQCVPSVDELRMRARGLIPHTPSLDEICDRAHELLLQASPR